MRSPFSISGAGELDLKLGRDPSALSDPPASSIVITVPSGLVGYWPLDDSMTDFTTNTTQDESGNSNTGSLAGMTSANLVGGRIGQALSFSGVAQYVKVPSAAVLNAAGAYSVCAWINTSIFGLGFISDWNGAAISKYRMFVGPFSSFGASGCVTAQQYSTGYTTVTSTAPVADGNWHHVCSYFDGSNLALYIDGALAAGPTATPGGSIAEADALLIGSAGNVGATGGLYFTGSIDDFRIYNRALLAAEILAIYQAGLAGKP